MVWELAADLFGLLLTFPTRNGSSELTMMRGTGLSGIVVLRQANAVTNASSAMSNLNSDSKLQTN